MTTHRFILHIRNVGLQWLSSTAKINLREYSLSNSVNYEVVGSVTIPHLALFFSLDYYFFSLMTNPFLLIIQCYHTITHSPVITITPPSTVIT